MARQRFDIYLVQLDPTVGSEIRKTRPCVIISPEEMNRQLRTVLVAPMTTKGRPAPFRVPCQFQRRRGQILLDQIRVADHSRLVQRLGQVSQSEETALLAALGAMFAR